MDVKDDPKRIEPSAGDARGAETNPVGSSHRVAKRSRRYSGRSERSVAIIGGGMGGITAAVRLQRAGFTNFTIFESESGPGGTWWKNVYPGSEVDVPSSVYSFSYHRFNWTRTHARQAELQAYLEEIVDAHDLRRTFRFSTTVVNVVWNDDEHRYHIMTSSGDGYEFDFVICAVGLLNDPKMPKFDGSEHFTGISFHTSMWPRELDLEGKDVGIIGVGSTSVQIVPSIAKLVNRLYVFQREPAWILPKGDRDYSDDERRALANPVRAYLRRLRIMSRYEMSQIGPAVHRPGSRRNREAEAAARMRIDRMFADRPDLRDAVTPKYVFSGKRRVRSDDYYPTLLRENVELVAAPITHMTSAGVVDARGIERRIDVLIYATGFKASEILSTLHVTGRKGVDLHEVWRDGAYAFLGMGTPQFPNLFFIYGPNTNSGAPITAMHERQAGYICRELKQMTRRGYVEVEIKESYSDRYNRILQANLSKTTWAQANNYMKAPSGRVVTQFPGGALLYTTLLRAFRRPGSKRS